MVAKESRFQTVEADQAESMGSEACEMVTDSIRRAPMTALLVGFGAGLAVGCMAIRAATQTRRQQQMSTAERLGKSIMESLKEMVPDAVSERFSR
jgi:hypothetical protein